MDRMIDRKIEFVKASPLCRKVSMAQAVTLNERYAHGELAAVGFHRVFGVLNAFDGDEEGSELGLPYISLYTVRCLP